MEKTQGDFVEILKSLDQIYVDSDGAIEKLHNPRAENLKAAFNKKYGSAPRYICRAPGRVNLIGEHIDYMGYGVFPFALDQDTLIAFSTNESSEIQISHTDPTKYADVTLPNDPNQEYKEKQTYYNYLLAGYKSVAVVHQSSVKSFPGLQVMVTGNVPIASGLSSSSSLVVCSGVMGLIALNLINNIQKDIFVDNLIKYERMLGTACGGMDQTASVYGQKNKALHIEFDPLKVTTVELPSCVSFVIANSLTVSEKLKSLGTRYNKRVCECRFALALLKNALKIDAELKNLSQLQYHLKASFQEVSELVRTHIEKKPYSQADIEHLLGKPVLELLKDIPYYELVLNSNTEYFPHERALHVFQEASRVYQFRDTCLDSSLDQQNKAVRLGSLMNESHESCRDLYDCSSKELDILVTLCRENGALGARLTGAGWGGCMVALVKTENRAALISTLKSKFYSNKDLNLSIPTGQDLDEYVFPTDPCKGAAVLEL